MKNNYFKISLYFTILIFCLSACKKADWYDVKSNAALAVPTTVQDMQALLDNASINNNCPSLGEVGSDGHIATVTTVNSLTNTEYDGYTWTLEKPFIKVVDWSTETFTGTVGPYQKVYICNLILEGLNKISAADTIEQGRINNVRGQALFLRAKSFYELAQIFAPPYQISSSVTDLSIPLRLESDLNIASTRSTVKQTYDQITSDLIQSAELLPVVPLTKNRASKPAAYALLARMFLSIEDYQKAGFYANACLNLQNQLLNYSSLSVTASLPIAAYNEEVIYHSRMFLYNSIRPTNMIIDTALYAMYDNNDLRKKIFFNASIQFKGSYSGSASIMFNGLATDEIFLIRAESYARAGDATKAMADLNILLSKRWSGAYTNMTAVNADDALIKVLNERKKELLLRGLRWSDLRRLNRDDRFKVTITRVVQGSTYTLTPGSFRYTYPIPQDIINFTGMQQNPGW